MSAEGEIEECSDWKANAGVSSEGPFIFRFCQKRPLSFVKLIFDESRCQVVVKDLCDAMLVK